MSSFFLYSCENKELVDFIVYNGTIYTVDSSGTVASAMAVKNGKIIATGAFDELESKYVTQERINLEGKYVYPGFIDAHCHFLYYGLFLQVADLTGTKSLEEVIERLKSYRSANPEKTWIIGKGWDQNDWEVKEFPSASDLDIEFTDIPVFLERIDGHAALANTAALKLANVNEASKVEGGIVEKKNGKPSGMLLDNAMDLVRKAIPPVTVNDKVKAMKDAEAACFSVGLTTVDEAGLDKEDILLIDSLQKSGDLKMRIYAMISDEKPNLDYFLDKGPFKTDRLNVRSVKVYVDGALGSRGACLLSPYADKTGEYGLLMNSPEHYKQTATSLKAKGFQMNSHCIGDSANRMILDIYLAELKGKNDLRWRIEHAQIVTDKDLEKFSAGSVIPSVQPVHATSDMYWAKERLGDRERTGYRYNDLLKSAGLIAIGSDFPVEHINPLYGYYASVTRKDRQGIPQGGYLPENKISRENALKGMTIWAAYSNFEEKEKGSLEPGKFADFVVLDQDLLTISDKNLHQVKVVYTYCGGKKVYQGMR